MGFWWTAPSFAAIDGVEAFVRSSALLSSKSSDAFGRLADLGEDSGAPAYHKMEQERELPPIAKPIFESSVSPIVEQPPRSHCRYPEGARAR